MKNLLKNPVMQNKLSMKVDNPAGNLLEEISEREMTSLAGGTNDWASKTAANIVGLGDNYGRVCTISAECAFTVVCGGTQ